MGAASETNSRRSMSATTPSTPEGTSPVVAASPAATPTPAPATITAADLAALATDPAAFEKAVSESGLNAAEIDNILNTPSAKPGNYEGKVPEVGNPPPAAAPVSTPPAAEAAPAAATPPATDPAKPAEGEDDADPLQALKGIKLKPSSFKDWEGLRMMKPRGGESPADLLTAAIKAYGPEATVARLRELGFSSAEAKAAVATQPAPAPEAAPAPAAESQAITDAKAKLADIETKLSKAKEDADVAAIADLTEERVMAKLEIREAEKAARESARAAEQAKATEATTHFRQRESAATQEIISAFPKLGDKASPERAEFQQFINLKYGDADYEAIFASPRWPVVLGREFAEAKGWNKAPAPVLPAGNPAPAPGAAPAPRVTAAEVLTPGATQGGANITAETFVQDLSKMSLKDLDQLLAASSR